MSSLHPWRWLNVIKIAYILKSYFYIHFECSVISKQYMPVVSKERQDFLLITWQKTLDLFLSLLSDAYLDHVLRKMVHFKCLLVVTPPIFFNMRFDWLILFFAKLNVYHAIISIELHYWEVEMTRNFITKMISRIP